MSYQDSQVTVRIAATTPVGAASASVIHKLGEYGWAELVCIGLAAQTQVTKVMVSVRSRVTVGWGDDLEVAFSPREEDVEVPSKGLDKKSYLKANVWKVILMPTSLVPPAGM